MSIQITPNWIFINIFCSKVDTHAWENFGAVKFYQIATDEANGEETFGASDDRSSVASPYLEGKTMTNSTSFTKNFPH